jgi:uncharacterized protein (DUF885 family)
MIHHNPYMLMLRVSLNCVAILLFCSPQFRAAQSVSEQTAREATRLADSYVEEFVATFPEVAEVSGLSLKSHDGLSDNSPAAIRKWQRFEDELAEKVSKLDSRTLQGRPAWTTLGFLKETVESGQQLRVCRQELWPVSQIFGWQVSFAQLAQIQPVETKQLQAEALRRWRQLPRYLEAEIQNLREGVRLGYTTPKHNVEVVLTQLDALLDQPTEKWPFYAPAQESQSEEFAAQWRQLLTDLIRPAVERYRQYLRSEYLPAARTSIALSATPNGDKCYAAMFRRWTSIDRPPMETYKMGIQQVDHNRAEALKIAKKMGINSLPALLSQMRSDPQDHFTNGDELLAFSRDSVARAREGVSKWFVRLPAGDVLIEPYPAFAEAGAAGGILYPPGPGGKPPATFRIPLSRLDETPRSRAERTAYHETYPGHALQLGLEAELPQLHPIVQIAGTSAFREGWARYAEALAEEMGLYRSKYGAISRRLWPSRGLALDTGIHIFGWSRQRAVAYILESGNMGPKQADALVDRIAITPGQITAYDTGASEIFTLREKTKQQLGADFDIKEFHEVVLQNGSVTLPMLRQQIESWLATKKHKLVKTSDPLISHRAKQSRGAIVLELGQDYTQNPGRQGQ